jgi:hypothetical protein
MTLTIWEFAIIAWALLSFGACVGIGALLLIQAADNDQED